MKDRIVIGKIIGAHGIRGEMKVFPITDDARRFLSLKEAEIDFEDRKESIKIKIRSARISGKNVLIMIEGIEERNQVEKFSGRFLSVDREHAVPLSEGAYFIVDLIGCTVHDDEMGTLGTIRDIIQTTGADIFVLSRAHKKDLLIPFLKSIVYEIDLATRSVSVRLPLGLYEIYES